jgi:hypothetical protein
LKDKNINRYKFVNIMSKLITINSIKMITSTSYILDKNVDCTICRQSLNNDSIYALEKGWRSTILTGLCGHTFHAECITPWLKTSLNCPICSQKFHS